MVKAIELRELEDMELDTRLSEARRELFNLRFQAVTGKLDNYSRLGQLRHDIARMSTILREREIAQAEGRFEDARPIEHVERPESGSTTQDEVAGVSAGADNGDDQ